MSAPQSDSVIILADLRHADSGHAGADALLVSAAIDTTLPQVLPVRDPPQVAPQAAALYAGPGEISHRALIESAALSGLPLLLDTSGATLKEVTRACGWHQLAFRAGTIARGTGKIRLPGGGTLCLLHGVIGDAPLNLRALVRMQSQTFLPVGFIDSSRDGVGSLAVALGACLLVRRPPGLAEYAAQIRNAEAALGNERKLPDASELAPVLALRRRVVAARSIAAGAVLESADLALANPGPGEGEFAPFQAASLVGRIAAIAIKAGQVIHATMLDGVAPEAAPWFAPRPPKQKP